MQVHPKYYSKFHQRHYHSLNVQTKSAKIQESCSTTTCILIALLLTISTFSIIIMGLHSTSSTANLYNLRKPTFIKARNNTVISEVLTNEDATKNDFSLQLKEASVFDKYKVLLPSLQVLDIYSKKETGAMDIHFIHVPKCGGTSMTSILRKVACSIDSNRNQDCCTNPGFCDWHAMRRCASIKGCTSHFPNRPWIFKDKLPSIAVLREPTSRLLSAFYYRGHSPNNDFFQVRPYFKDIRDGKLPKVMFPEYIEMPEYQNIITRMFGADSFPYKNVTITDKVFEAAVDALDHMFFIAIQEVYDISVKVMLREFNMTHLDIPIEKERDQSVSKKVTEEKMAIKSNATLMSRVRENNKYDVRLYSLAVSKVSLLFTYITIFTHYFHFKFCLICKKYQDLRELLKQKSAICDAYFA